MTDFDWQTLTQRRGGPPADGPNLDPALIFKWLWLAAITGFVIVAALGSYYTVEANEEAVVLRFGEFYTTAGPGFHSKLPFVDRAYKGEVKTVHKAEFGYRTVEAGVKSRFDYTSREVMDEATMLTADLNIAMVSWEVRYKISDLKSFLFDVREPVITLGDISQAVMREEVGDRSIDEVLTLDRSSIEDAVMTKMQAQLTAFGCGIMLVSVNLKRVDPPDKVRDAFNAVNQAIQVRDRIVNEAEGTRNQKIPAARGGAEKIIKEAEGYKIGRKNRAEGDTQAFLSVLEEYRKAEDITRRRLYVESMEATVPRIGDITVIDEGAGGVLKLLDLTQQAAAAAAIPTHSPAKEGASE